VIISGDMMGFTRPGLSAEKVAVGEHLLAPVPPNLSFEEAAVIPASYLTSYLALTRTGQVQAGDTLLVTGATGAAGTAAVQIGKMLGATVFAVTRSEKDVKVLINFGADHVIDVSKQNLTDGKGVKIIAEFVGGEIFSEALAAIAPGGKLISIGYAGGRTTTIPIFGLLLTGAIIQGFSLFAFPPQVIGAAYQEILQGFAEGKLKVNIERKFAIDEISEAHRQVAQRSGVGRFVLSL
jgi:NADPH:quinone reductase